MSRIRAPAPKACATRNVAHAFCLHYNHFLYLKNAKKTIAIVVIIPRIIQKSPSLPTIGVVNVFIPNMDVNSVRGKVTKARIVKTFIISFCFVVRSAEFVFLKSSNVTNSAVVLRMRWK